MQPVATSLLIAVCLAAVAIAQPSEVAVDAQAGVVDAPPAAAPACDCAQLSAAVQTAQANYDSIVAQCNNELIKAQGLINTAEECCKAVPGLESSLLTATSSLDACKASSGELTAEVTALKAAAQQQDFAVEKLNKIVTACEDNAAQAASRIAGLTSTVAALEAELLQSKSSVGDLSASKASAEAQISQLTAEFQEKIAALTAAAASKDAQLSALQETAAAGAKSLAAAQAALVTAQADAAAAQSSAAEHKTRADTAEGSVAQLQQTVSSKSDEVAALSSKLQISSARVSALEATVSEASSKLGAVKAPQQDPSIVYTFGYLLENLWSAAKFGLDLALPLAKAGAAEAKHIVQPGLDWLRERWESRGAVVVAGWASTLETKKAELSTQFSAELAHVYTAVAAVNAARGTVKTTVAASFSKCSWPVAVTVSGVVAEAVGVCVDIIVGLFVLSFLQYILTCKCLGSRKGAATKPAKQDQQAAKKPAPAPAPAAAPKAKGGKPPKPAEEEAAEEISAEAAKKHFDLTRKAKK